MVVSFKSEFPFEKRYNESLRVIRDYPDRVPIICERSNINTIDCPYIDKKKYLVPRDLTLGQFLYVIRRRLKLTAEKALFLFIANKIHASSQRIDYLYNVYKDNDGFLYISYSYENTFG